MTEPRRHVLYELRAKGCKERYHGITCNIDRRHNSHHLGIATVVHYLLRYRECYFRVQPVHRAIAKHVVSKHRKKLRWWPEMLQKLYIVKIVATFDTKEEASAAEVEIIKKTGALSLNAVKYKNKKQYLIIKSK